MADEIVTLPVKWVRLDAYCKMTGEPGEAVAKRILDGEWAAGKHYKRTSQRVLWVNLIEAGKWVEQQPHVEASFRKGSKSEKGGAKAA